MTQPLRSSDEIVAAIQGLSPAERRQLQVRLRVSGLFVPEEHITDQNRLQVAPALGNAAAGARDKQSPAQKTQPPAEITANPVAPTSDPPEPYQSPVSGKVVVGAPNPTANLDDPHLMHPLPGQAPEQPIRIVFDGGSKGNPGLGYGSYALYWPGAQPQIVKLRFGNQVTNNEAEYDTLIAALEAVRKRLLANNAELSGARLDVRGDSLLVINQVLGKWKIKEPRLAARCQRARQLLQDFGHWQLAHHDRSRSVAVLGH